MKIYFVFLLPEKCFNGRLVDFMKISPNRLPNQYLFHVRSNDASNISVNVGLVSVDCEQVFAHWEDCIRLWIAHRIFRN